MTDAEIAAYFQGRGFTVLAAPTRAPGPAPELSTMLPISVLQERLRAIRGGAPASRPGPKLTNDLVTLRIQSRQRPDERPPFTVVFSRSLGRVVGEQD